MNIWSVLIGVALGAVGGALHLALTRWRASQLRERHATLILATYPLGLAIPAIFVLGAAAIARQAAWASVLGLAASQIVWLGVTARRLRRE